MNLYIIHDIRYGTYYTSGRQLSRGGQIGPRWTNYRSDAIKFNSISEAKAVMYRLKKIKCQDNRCVVYERY